MGAQTRVCRANGEWSHSIPSCRSESLGSGISSYARLRGVSLGREDVGVGRSFREGGPGCGAFL